MNRRSFLQNAALTLGALSLSQQKVFSALFQQTWKIHMFTDSVGIFTDRGGTIMFLLSKKGTVVVDAQFPAQSKALIEELKRRSDNPFRYLINTHHHGDHTSGNISFKGIVQHVVAHKNSKKNQVNVANAQNTAANQLFPDKVYTDEWQRRVGGESIVMHYFGAGHTNGDSLVHFENTNIVHMGDLMFNRLHPFVDRNAGADMKNWIKVLHKATRQFDSKTIYVYGHAAEGYNIAGKADDLKAFADYLDKTLQFVEKEIKAGKTKEQVLKTTSIPGADQWKGSGISRPLTAAYDELMAK